MSALGGAPRRIIAALMCVVDWTLGTADVFARFPRYGSIGVTVLGLLGLGADESKRAARVQDR